MTEGVTESQRLLFRKGFVKEWDEDCPRLWHDVVASEAEQKTALETEPEPSPRKALGAVLRAWLV